MRVEFVSLLLIGVSAWASAPVDVSFSEKPQIDRLMREKKYTEAAILLRSVIQDSSLSINDSLPFVLKLTEALSRSGRREEALVLLGQYSNQTSGNRQLGLLRRSNVLSRTFLTEASFRTHQDGVNLLRALKIDAAIEKFNSVFLSEPDNVEVLMRLGQCHLLKKEFGPATERFRQSKRLLPFEPEIQLWLGRTLFQKGDTAEAIEALNTAYKKLGDQEISALWLAEALWGSGLKNRALRVLDEDIRKHSNHYWSLVRWARYRLAFSKDAQALANIRRVLQDAMSQINEYPETRMNETEFSSGLPLIKRDELEKEAKSLLLQRE